MYFSTCSFQREYIHVSFYEDSLAMISHHAAHLIDHMTVLRRLMITFCCIWHFVVACKVICQFFGRRPYISDLESPMSDVISQILLTTNSWSCIIQYRLIPASQMCSAMISMHAVMALFIWEVNNDLLCEMCHLV